MDLRYSVSELYFEAQDGAQFEEVQLRNLAKLTPGAIFKKQGRGAKVYML